MIDIEYAEKAFKKYLKDFDLNNEKIALKVRHTYSVLNASEYVSKKLNLDEENIKLANLIALLHDIGRFEQLKKFDSYDDFNTIDHAEAGINLLFSKKENNEIVLRDFIEYNKYDDIIFKAIKNHNKYAIEDGLNKTELLHAKLIRDCDKIDNFKVKETESCEALFGISEKEFENEKLSDFIFEAFKEEKLIDSRTAKTNMDRWVSYIAFIFDYNFKESIEYVKEHNYINIIVDRIDYKDKNTYEKMQEIRNIANTYIEKRIKK